MQNLLSRLQGLIFYLLFIAAFALLASLTQKYALVWDWTVQGRNSLSPTSVEVVGRLQSPLKITAYAQEIARLREPLQALVGRYQRQSDKISLAFVNPDREPDLVRELGIRTTGELVLEYQGRTEYLPHVNEERLTNAIQRLLMGAERWIAFLDGHGERNPEGKANHDLGEFGKELTNKGYQLRRVNLSEHPDLPQNLSLLVIAGPEVDLLPAEVEAVRAYINAGGNLFWLLDPNTSGNSLHGLEPLAEELGLGILPGIIVDANAFAMGIKDPAMALITRYPEHEALAGLDQISVFPKALAFEIKAQDQDGKRGWQASALLETLERTWNETGPITGEIRPDDEGERPGPLTLAVALERHLAHGEKKRQKLILIGDGDFLSNSVLGNGGNLSLGFNLVRWLADDESLLGIAPKTAIDLDLALSQNQALLMGLVFLLILPLGFFGLGFWIWRRRHQA